MMNVLLTGGTGFLGRTISRTLSSSDCKVFQLTSGSQKNRIDISKPFDLELDRPVQTIIHAAGNAHSIPKTDSEQQSFFDVNYLGTKNLCKAIEGLNILPKSIVFISTVAVYGVDEGILISEDHPLKGETVYAKSKILAEEWLHEWTYRHQIPLGILRLPLIAGPNPPRKLGAMVRGIQTGRYLSIGQASDRKSMVWAEDIARIIPKLSERGGIYNLTDGFHPTFGELEQAIAQALKTKRPVKVPYWFANILAKTGDLVGNRFPINSERLQKMVSTLTFDDRKARGELGWNPNPVLDKIDHLVNPFEH